MISIEKKLPMNPALEEALIASVLIDNSVVDAVEDTVSAADFSYEPYGIAWHTILGMRAAHQAIDVQTLTDELRARQAPAELLDSDFLCRIVATTVTTTNARDHAARVHALAAQRRVIRTLSDQLVRAYDQSAEKTCADVEDSIKKIDVGRDEDEGWTDQCVAALREMEEASKRADGLIGLTTGFDDLDHATSGLQHGHFNVLAGAPGMGKSALALCIMAAQDPGTKIALFSLEMQPSELIKRMASIKTGIELTKVIRGTLTDEEWPVVTEALTDIASRSIHCHHLADTTVADIRRKCRKHQAAGGLDLVIIDHLQLMAGAGRNESRVQEVAGITRGLKNLAVELDVPVLVLSQLSRDVRKRDNHRPVLADLRDSGTIEQDADDVWFIHRDDYADYDIEDPDEYAQIIIAKQRQGMTGTIRARWEPECTRFSSVSPDEKRYAAEAARLQAEEVERKRTEREQKKTAAEIRRVTREREERERRDRQEAREIEEHNAKMREHRTKQQALQRLVVTSQITPDKAKAILETVDDPDPDNPFDKNGNCKLPF